jgi:hypothetical protein
VPRRAMTGDAQLADQGAVRVVVVAAVGVDLRGLAAGAGRVRADRWDRLQQWDELGDVVAVAGGQQHRQRDTAGVGDQMVFGAQPGCGLQDSGRFWAALERPHMAGIHDGPRQVQLAGGGQLGEQYLVQALPDTGVVPVATRPPARHATAEAEFVGQPFPASRALRVGKPMACGPLDPGRQPRKAAPIREWRGSGQAAATRRVGMIDKYNFSTNGVRRGCETMTNDEERGRGQAVDASGSNLSSGCSRVRGSSPLGSTDHGL